MSRFASSATARPFTTYTAFAALTAMASLTPPAVASAAQPATEPTQTTLYYSLRDLSTDQGTRALYQRIVTAARTVCPGYDSADLAAFAYSRQCGQQALARAVRQIGNARLAAVYSQKLPKRG
jgi:UrcA family protein